MEEREERTRVREEQKEEREREHAERMKQMDLEAQRIQLGCQSRTEWQQLCNPPPPKTSAI